MTAARSALARAMLVLAAVAVATPLAPAWAQEHDRGPEHREARGHERERHERRRPERREYYYVRPETVYAPPPVIYAPPPPPAGINLIIPFSFR